MNETTQNINIQIHHNQDVNLILKIFVGPCAKQPVYVAKMFFVKNVETLSGKDYAFIRIWNIK